MPAQCRFFGHLIVQYGEEFREGGNNLENFELNFFTINIVFDITQSMPYRVVLYFRRFIESHVGVNKSSRLTGQESEPTFSIVPRVYRF